MTTSGTITLQDVIHALNSSRAVAEELLGESPPSSMVDRLQAIQTGASLCATALSQLGNPDLSINVDPIAPWYQPLICGIVSGSRC